MVFLVSAVSFLAKNITAFLVVLSLIDGYIFFASPDAIVALSLSIFNSSSLYSRSDAWTMETRE